MADFPAEDLTTATELPEEADPNDIPCEELASSGGGVIVIPNQNDV